MLNDNVFYWGIIRKTVIAFGNLFSNIYIDRKSGDSVTGDTVQRLQVPITYAPKEKWIVRLEQDTDLKNYTYITLPRMSFEITGYNYDATRKVGKMQKIVCHKDGQASDMFSPVPWNLDITLYVLTKTQEDGLQIIEQILPTFSPEYTLSINAVPDMNVIQDIPIALTSVNVEDNYDGDFQTRRFVTHTLTFSAKLNLYGAMNSGKPIYHVDVGIGTKSIDNIDFRYHADGNPTTGQITESWTEDL